jgi:sulfate adenylyltransferase subunit 1
MSTTVNINPIDITSASLSTTPLRIATAGSVDDGKSTLIGRLLHDTKTIMEDQLASVERASHRYGDGSFNLALLTDGLRAEREQGITIDVAYRYFATPRRRFILADSPGHVQYTRNMVTAASRADVAIVLIDAVRGTTSQTRRHTYIASLLGVSTIVFAVNKMDATGWDRAIFDGIARELKAYLAVLPQQVPTLTIPVSALHGDNIVDASTNTPWYDGPSLLDFLEQHSAPGTGTASETARLDVQWTLRDYTQNYRAVAGRLAGGRLAVGDHVTLMPSGQQSTVQQIDRGGTSLQHAVAGQSISVVLADDLDASRGDVLVTNHLRGAAFPASAQELTVDVCWMSETPLTEGDRVWFKHNTRSGRATVTRVLHRVDVDTAQYLPTDSLALNDLGRIELVLSEPIAATRFVDQPTSGRLILIDERTNNTAGAAIVV